MHACMHAHLLQGDGLARGGCGCVVDILLCWVCLHHVCLHLLSVVIDLHPGVQQGKQQAQHAEEVVSSAH